jgi:hypothetical protein
MTMCFSVLKTYPNGEICEHECYTIDEALTHIINHQGWTTREDLHNSIRQWVKNIPYPGSIFRTFTTAIVARIDRDLELRICTECEANGEMATPLIRRPPTLPGDYGDNPRHNILEQVNECPLCRRKWRDHFLHVRRELIEGPKREPAKSPKVNPKRKRGVHNKNP